MHSVLKIAVCHPCVISYQMVARAQDIFYNIFLGYIKISLIAMHPKKEKDS